MSISIKVCGVTDPENVERLATLKPDYFGVILVESSPRFVSSFDVVRRIHSSSGESKLVAVVKDPDLSLLSDICSLDVFHAVQIHGARYKESADYIRTHSRSLQIWQALSLDEETIVEELINGNTSDKIVFDGKSPGSGVPFNWNTLLRQNISIPFFIAGGIGPENSRAVVETFMRHEHFRGLDINSRVESSPGIKNYNLVADVMVAVGRMV
jgi:phosphoribosylanthranilate isomerase